MALILCIETATTNCSVALAENNTCLQLKEDRTNQYSHAEQLHVFIEDILSSCGKTLKDLDAVAISKGPGSYTGLRIGVSTVKGLCFSLDIPLISIETLNALAHQVEGNDGIIIPMLDARRMEVFSAIYNAQHQEIRATEAQILDEHSFVELLDNNKVSFIGNGVLKFKDICKHSNASFIDSLPSAKEMIPLAHKSYLENAFEDVAYFEPFYLKDFVAGKKKA